MKYRYYLFLFLSIFLFSSCSKKSEEKFVLEGNIKGYSQKMIFLEELGFNGSKVIDTVRTDNDGSFVIENKYTEPALYRLRMEDDFLFVVIDGERIHLSADIQHLDHYTSKGSKGTESLIEFQNRYFNLNQELLGLRMAYDTATQNTKTDSTLNLISNSIQKKSSELIEFVKNYADTTKSLPVAIFTASKLFPYEEETPYLQKLSASLPNRFTSTALSRDFVGAIMERVQLLSKKKSQGLHVGSMAPDFEIASSVDGELIQLNTYKGKYLLIDFWASWCPPCRAENPNVVAVYTKHQGNDFMILGISLDEKKDKWLNAVKEDNLSWDQASDLKGWESDIAELYGVQSIPTNYLIDPTGKIIASNLRGAELERTINEALKSIVKK